MKERVKKQKQNKIRLNLQKVKVSVSKENQITNKQIKKRLKIHLTTVLGAKQNKTKKICPFGSQFGVVKLKY